MTSIYSLVPRPAADIRRATASVLLGLATGTVSLGAQTPSTDPPARVARVSAVAGAVSLLAAGDSDWTSAPLNYTVTSGDRLNTNLNSRAELEVGPLTMRLSEATDVDVTNLSDHLAQLGLSRGVLRLSVYRLLPTDVIEIDTPSGAVTVRALGQYRVSVGADYATTVVVDNGAADVSAGGTDQTVRSGQALRLAGSGDANSRWINRPAVDAFDRWSADRDRRVLGAACGTYMSRDIPGCADLDEHGRWLSDATYGTVWYPTAVSADWVPYRQGRWAYSDAYGWVWVEDEPWGFAPFHYGRWVYARAAWGWVPGPIVARPYYAPALVAWVGGPRVGVVVSVGVSVVQAWFPLGPNEYYYPSYYHSDRYVRQVNVTNIYVTNITNVAGGQNVRYVNKDAGLTAVPSSTFGGRRAVGPNVVAVNGRGYTQSQVTTSPTAAPIPRRSGSVNNRVVAGPASPYRGAEVRTAAPAQPPGGSLPPRPVSPQPTYGDERPAATRPAIPTRGAQVRSAPVVTPAPASAPPATMQPPPRSEVGQAIPSSRPSVQMRQAVPPAQARQSSPPVAAPARPPVSAAPGASARPQGSAPPSAAPRPSQSAPAVVTRPRTPPPPIKPPGGG